MSVLAEELVDVDQALTQLLAEETPDRVCVILDDDDPCVRPAVIVLRMGCVHEHMGDTPLCQFHVEAAAAGELLCPRCHVATLPHSCRLEVLGEVLASGERRVLPS